MGRQRIDVLILHRGFRVALEGSYRAGDSEKDAEKRLRSGAADLAVAVWYDESEVPQEIPDSEIEKRLEKAILRVKLFASGGDITKKLSLPQTRATAPGGWLEVSVPLLRDVVDRLIELAVSEENVKKLEGEVEALIKEFSRVLSSADPRMVVCRGLYDIFYKLYGLSVGDPVKIGELVYGKAALALLLSAVFYESIRAHHGLPPLRDLKESEGPLPALLRAFEEALRVNYQAVLEVARDVAGKLPPTVSAVVGKLVDLAERIAHSGVLLRRDFTGRVYHKVIGDWSVRKGFATYFTSVPAAYLLARLALVTRNPSWRVFDTLGSVGEFRVADLACGSGTLLSASYDALLYLYVRDSLGAGRVADLDGFHRTVLESVLWGLDALRYAVHVAATTLSLHNPGVPPRNTNIYSVPLGVSPDGVVSLGSLDVVKKSLRDFFRKGTATRVSPSAAEEYVKISLPESFDLVIMNPPFTRATGRGGKEGGGLFGFVANGNARKRLVESYVRFREEAREELVEVAKSEGLLEELERTLGDKAALFTNIGQAGEGALFLYTASKVVADGGRVAFVLPKTALSGISWFLLRALLVSRFHTEYIVVSYDHGGGYNFSESTNLSECLVVARKVGKHEESERTYVVALTRKPGSALESVWLAHEIAELTEGGGEAPGEYQYVRAGRSCGAVYSVSRRSLLKHLDNWGRLAAFPDPWLSTYALELLEGTIRLGGRTSLRVPVRRLGDVASIGIDRHQFHDSFDTKSASGYLPCVYGGEEEVRRRISVVPNARAAPRSSRAAELFREHASNLLVPEVLRVNTAHVISLYSEEPALSNVFYAVKLRSGGSGSRLKALCAWLNSTWGLLTVLASRQETEGHWVRLKIGHWKLLPVLDVESLSDDTIEALSEVLEKFKNTDLPRIPEQYAEHREERLKLDLEVMKALNPAVDSDEAERALRELYRAILQSFLIASPSSKSPARRLPPL